jgi:hypothetical protein
MTLLLEKNGSAGSRVDTDRSDAMAKQNHLLVTKTVRLSPAGNVSVCT